MEGSPAGASMGVKVVEAVKEAPFKGQTQHFQGRNRRIKDSLDNIGY